MVAVVVLVLAVSVSAVGVGLDSVAKEVKDFFNSINVLKDELVDFFDVVNLKVYAVLAPSNRPFRKSKIISNLAM